MKVALTCQLCIPASRGSSSLASSCLAPGTAAGAGPCPPPWRCPPAAGRSKVRARSPAAAAAAGGEAAAVEAEEAAPRLRTSTPTSSRRAGRAPAPGRCPGPGGPRGRGGRAGRRRRRPHGRAAPGATPGAISRTPS